MTISATRPSPEEAAPATGRFLFLLASCLLIMVLEGIDIQALGIAAPILMPALGIDSAQAGVIFGMAQVGGVFGALLGGKLSDVWGRRNALFFSTLIFGGGTLLTVFAFDFQSLLVIRTLTGFGIGAALPNVIGLVAEAAPARHRIKAVTLVLAGMPLGGALISLFAAMLMGEWGWRSLFVFGGVLPLLLMFSLAFIPNRKPAPSAEQGAKSGFVRLLQEKPDVTLLLWAVFFLTAGMMYMMLNWLPTLIHARGFSIVDGQMTSLSFNLASIVGPLVVGSLIDKHGYKHILPLCYLGFLAGIAALAFADGFLALQISVAVVGFFLLGAQFSLNGVAASFYPPEIRGLGVGAALAVGRVGSILGPLAAGYILQSGGGVSGVTATMIPIVALSAVAMALLARRVQKAA